MKIIFSLIFFLSLYVGVDKSFAQEDNSSVKVNFIYAFELGFGSYDVGGLDVKVFKIPLAYTFENFLGNEKTDLTLNFPIYYGHFNFEIDLDESTSLEIDQDILSIIPGLELKYEILNNWYIKPYVDFGFGWAIDTDLNTEGIDSNLIDVDDSSIYLYSLGVGSLYEIFWKRFTFSIGNKIAWSGYSTFDGDNNGESFGVLENGIEAKHPLGFYVRGYEPDMSVFFNWYHFLPDTQFDRFQEDPLIVENQYEIATTIGLTKKLENRFIKKPRIGIGYRFGDLKAFTVNFGFPF